MWGCHVDMSCGCVMWVCHVGVSCGCVMWVYHVGLPCGFIVWEHVVCGIEQLALKRVSSFYPSHPNPTPTPPHPTPPRPIRSHLIPSDPTPSFRRVAHRLRAQQGPGAPRYTQGDETCGLHPARREGSMQQAPGHVLHGIAVLWPGDSGAGPVACGDHRLRPHFYPHRRHHLGLPDHLPKDPVPQPSVTQRGYNPRRSRPSYPLHAAVAHRTHPRCSLTPQPRMLLCCPHAPVNDSRAAYRPGSDPTRDAHSLAPPLPSGC